MSNELAIVDEREVLGKQFRIYGSTEEPLFLVKDVAEWIEYDASKASRLVSAIDDETEKVRHFVSTLGGPQEAWFITEDGLYEVLMQSRKPIAKQFKRVVKDILKTIRKTGHYETPEYKALLQIQQQNAELTQRLLQLEQKFDKRFKPQTNPRYVYDYCWNNYAHLTGDESRRGLNGALDDYFGHVPYARNIRPIPVKDWVCKHITAEAVEEFVNGIEDGLIVLSQKGHWVNLGGINSNEYEWPKILEQFNHECAYCGISENEVNLMPEHIIPQSYLSMSNPELVDLIGNIVPSCSDCNRSKDTRNVDEWYEEQPFYKPWKLERIHKWQEKFRLAN